MIRLVNRITDERNYWRAKCELSTVINRSLRMKGTNDVGTR